jgi:type II secretory pathway pseudopilin PulG
VNALRRARSGGYTLLEIAIVLFIIVLLAGIALPAGNRFRKEAALRDCASALSLHARTARRLALQTQRPYEIRFSTNGFYVNPVEAVTNADELATLQLPEHPMNPNLRWQLFRWGERKPSELVEDSWIFEPSGICEPLRVRFTETPTWSDQPAWIELAFHPLTAGVTEESYEFP